MGCHFLLQGIFLTQGLNLGLLHGRQIIYCSQGRDFQMTPYSLRYVTNMFPLKVTLNTENNPQGLESFFFSSSFFFKLSRCLLICSVAKLCLTLCDPMDCSLPGSTDHRIFQAKVLKWAAISFSRGSSRPRDRTWASCTTGRFFPI